MRTLNPNLRLLLFICSAISLTQDSCKSDDSLLQEKSLSLTATAQTTAKADAARNNIDNIIFNIVLGYDEIQINNTAEITCFKRTVDPSTDVYPQTVTIEYTNCPVQEGVIKKGKIIQEGNTALKSIFSSLG